MCCGNDAPSPDPLIGEAAKANAELAAKAYDWYMKTYEEDIKPRQERMDSLTQDLVSDYLDTSQQNKAMARQQLERQQALFFPVEEQMVRDSMNYDSAERMERESGKAAADVNQQFSNARSQTQRNLAAYGLRPDSGAFAALNTKLTLGQALGSASAQNQARTAVQDKAIALRGGTANFGRGLGNQASSGFSTAIASNQGAGGQQGAAVASGLNSAQFAGQGFSTAMQGYNSAGNLAYQNTSAQLAAYQAEQAPFNALLGAAGTAAGIYMGKKMADGGLAKKGAIRGPGGPVDDKIPAMLSNGEYVLPADTVEAIGKKKLDKVVEKTHTPAAVQRRRAKQALKKGRK